MPTAHQCKREAVTPLAIPTAQVAECSARTVTLREMRAPKVGVLVLLAVVAWAGSSYADVTVSPPSGPPGTVVTVSGITTCEGPTQPELWFSKADRTRPGDLVRVPFTPPSGTIVVPNVPEGEYDYVFVVTPGFTG